MIPFQIWIRASLKIQRRAHQLTHTAIARGLSYREVQEPHEMAERTIELMRRRIDPSTVPQAFALAWGLTPSTEAQRSA